MKRYFLRIVSFTFTQFLILTRNSSMNRFLILSFPRHRHIWVRWSSDLPFFIERLKRAAAQWACSWRPPRSRLLFGPLWQPDRVRRKPM
jgi:hypothetical protein